ncbi:MAG: glycosyltransferase family 39 protein [Candidatus Binatia bacterium]|nr:glycosyltransferase family 39 protein [Candidatus Binatia bacterium]
MLNVRALASALVLAQLLALGVVGARVTRDTPVFGPIDERSHYSYVQFVSEEGRLPLLRDTIRPEVSALARGIYPQESVRPAELMGIWGKVYEAFQPPLYYVVAAAVSRLTTNHRTQVTILRAFGVALLFGLAALLLELSRRLFGEEWPIAAAYVLNVVLLPGVVVRSVHIGNAGLEILGATFVLLCLQQGFARRSALPFWAAGVMLGVTLLTRLTAVSFAFVLVLAVATAVRRGILARGRGALVVALPPLVLAPWVAFNFVHYGAATANGVARGMQMHIINPQGKDHTLGDAASHFATQLFSYQQMVLPQEWAFPVGGDVARVILGLSSVLFFLPLGLAPFLRGRARAGVEAWLFGWPLPLSIVLSVVLYAWQDWPMLVRYTYCAFPAAMIFGYAVLRRYVGTPVLLSGAALTYGFLVALWAWAPVP